MWHPFVPGISERTYTDEQLANIDPPPFEYQGKTYSAYEATQKQRQIERAMRKSKREFVGYEAAGQTEAAQDSAIRLRRLSQEYKSFSKAAGLRTQPERARVDGFKTQNGHSMIASEQSPRPNKKEKFSVNWKIVQSEQYSRKFDGLSTSSRANVAVQTRAKWALNNRDGLNTEEIYAIDMRTGEEVGRITDQHHPRGVKRTEQFDRALKTEEKSGAKIMLIHNHPGGLPPSIGDINALLPTPGAQGITVGHDGSIYRYTAPSKKIPQSDFDVAFSKNLMYTTSTAYEKALEELSNAYGFTFERL